MPKFLYLMRHAHSAEKQPGQTDKDRELTPVGVKEALRMGAFLASEKITPDIIYTSEAARAVTTSHLLCDALKLDYEKIIQDEELYRASVRTFFELIENIDMQFNRVMCVAHNPVISYLAEYLTKAEIGDMTTAGIAAIRFDIPSWKDISEGNGELIQYTSPSMLLSD